MQGSAARKSRGSVFLIFAVSACALMAGCKSDSPVLNDLAPEDDAPIFSSSVFGVPASPRVTRFKKVRKGGGRFQVGKPYQVRGKWYYPKEEPGYSRSGKGSWYGANFHGRLTANGEVYDMYGLSGAHPTFPLPSYARVTNRKNGRSVVVRVNDRGPYWSGRVMDVSSKAAEVLGFKQDGIGDIKVDYVGRAPLEGDDTKVLMASFRAGNGRPIDDGLPPGVMTAERQPDRAPTVRVASAFAAGRSSHEDTTSIAMHNSAEPVGDLGASELPSAPVPVPSSLALSYASGRDLRGAAAALSTLSTERPERERIEIGLIDDIGLLARISELTQHRGRLVEEHIPQGIAGVSIAFEPRTGEDIDLMLRALWKTGASDAFVVRD